MTTPRVTKTDEGGSLTVTDCNDDGALLFGPNYVMNKQYELHKGQHETYTYPIDGWKWFDDEDAAYLEYGLEKYE